MSERPDSEEPNVYFVPEGDDIVVVVHLGEHITVQVRGRTPQIRELAQAILAVEPKWLGPEFVDFAQGILARKAASFPLPSHLPQAITIRNDHEYAEAEKCREVGAKLRSLLRDVFSETFRRLQHKATDWDRGEGPNKAS